MEFVEEDPPGVGGNRRREGDIGGSAGLAKVERLDLRDTAAGNEDRIE